MKEIVISSQEEYDALPADYEGLIIVKGNASINVRDSSTVTAHDSSTVTAHDSSTVTAYGYSQVVDCDDCDITLSGCARRVTLPANIQEYSDWYGIPIVDGKIKLYKAVRKHETGVYHSDYDPEFLYSVGKEYEQDCGTNRNEQCARGLHVAYLDWAVNYCCDWMNAAILEVEVPIECIVVPRNTDGKIRTSKLKVLREVPREEWR